MEDKLEEIAELLKRILGVLDSTEHTILERLEDVNQTIKAVGIAQIELPQGSDPTLALEQIEINIKGIQTCA